MLDQSSDAPPIAPESPITLKSLAAELGLTAQAVSLALRDRRGVSEATRARVRALAAARGYRPDAGLRALADYRLERRAASSRWNHVALVHDWPTARAFRDDEFYGRLCTTLDAVAGEQGLRIETAWLGHRGAEAGAALRRLHHRGITGLLLAPPALDPSPSPVDLPLDRFQVVSFGPQHVYPHLHTVTFDFYENLRLAWERLREAGHRRIGLVYRDIQGWRTGEAWRGAYHVEKQLAGFADDDLPPLRLEERSPANRDRFRAWARVQRVDAVISSAYPVRDWAAGLRPAPVVALFNVREPGQAGIDLNLRQLARSALELLLLDMRRSLMVGTERLPLRVLIPGTWVGVDYQVQAT